MLASRFIEKQLELTLDGNGLSRRALFEVDLSEPAEQVEVEQIALPQPGITFSAGDVLVTASPERVPGLVAEVPFRIDVGRAGSEVAVSAPTTGNAAAEPSHSDPIEFAHRHRENAPGNRKERREAEPAHAALPVSSADQKSGGEQVDDKRVAGRAAFDFADELEIRAIRKARHDAKVAARRAAKHIERKPGMQRDQPKTETVAYFTVKDLAVRFRVSVATIWRWSKENSGFPAPLKVCGSTRWRRSDVEMFENGLETS